MNTNLLSTGTGIGSDYFSFPDIMCMAITQGLDDCAGLKSWCSTLVWAQA